MEHHLERLTALICLWTPDGVLSSCNAAYSEFLGVPRDNLIGRRWLDLLPGTHRPSAAGFMEDFLANPRPYQGEQVVRHPSGELRWVEWISQPILDAQGQLSEVLSEGRDITGRKRAEEAAREIERRYRDATLVLLRLLNEHDQTRELLAQLADLLRVWAGCEAVAVRLREGEDFPFHETRGFSSDFVRTERSLCRFDQPGGHPDDREGDEVAHCVCARVASGQTDPSLSCFSPRGSFWTNSLAAVPAGVRSARTRCLNDGYQSLALIPLRLGNDVLGLLHLSDRSPGRFNETIIEFLENAAEQIALGLAQKVKRSSLEGGLRQIAALLADLGVGARDEPSLPPALRAALATLSRRETEVLRLLLMNRRPTTIAKELSRSVHTVRNQLKSIFRKLNVHSQEELLSRLGSNPNVLAVRAPEDARRARRRNGT